MISGQSKNNKKLVLRWQGTAYMPTTYLALAGSAVVCCAYLSYEPLEVFPNKIQALISRRILSEAISNKFGYDYTVGELDTLIKRKLGKFIETGPEEIDDIYVTIPLFSNYWSGNTMIRMPLTGPLNVLKTLYGSIYILNPDNKSLKFINEHCLTLSQETIEFFIDNQKVDRPCAICKNKEDYDADLGVCLYQTPGYMCLLHNNLDADLKTSIELSTKLSMFNDTDVAYMDAVFEALDNLSNTPSKTPLTVESTLNSMAAIEDEIYDCVVGEDVDTVEDDVEDTVEDDVEDELENGGDEE